MARPTGDGAAGGPARRSAGSAAGGEDRPLTLGEAAVRHGAYRWIEHRLFELTGMWAAAPSLPDGMRILLFEASAQHAWHAQLWADRLPVLAGVDADRLTRPVGDVAGPLLSGLEPAGDGGAGLGDGGRFLAGLTRDVLPRLLDSYRGFGRCLVAATDGPSIRALTLVVRDEEEELGAADALLAGKFGEGTGGGEGAAGGELFPWQEAEFPW